jgi:hypothetical protein
MDIELAEAMWRLGVLPPEALPGLAREALEQGLEGPSLEALAELHAPTRLQAGGLFEEALSEIGRPPMSLPDAGLRLAQDLAAKILTGELTPQEGAHRIVWDVWDRCRELERLGVFVTLEEALEKQPEHRDLVEEGIRREARRLASDA